MIPLHQHPLWPYLLEGGYESSANNLTLKKWGMGLDADDTVQIPKQHSVYMFVTEDQDVITWYRDSNMITVNGGVLYYVYYEHNHLLGSYAWLSANRAAEYLTVKNTPLTYNLTDRLLVLHGLHIHRHTGEVVTERGKNRALAKCIEMRPFVPWYSKGFMKHDFEAIYRRPVGRVRISNKIIRIQRWWRGFEPKRRPVVWTQFRNMGFFVLLCDDLFAAIVALSTVSRPRQLECEFSLRRPPDARM